MSKTGKRVRNLLIFASASALVLTGVLAERRHNVAVAANPPPASAPLIPVTVETADAQKLRVWSEFSGRLTAVDYAEIRPEVSGRITEVRFRDGQNVKAGDILYVVDPRPFEAALAKAEADRASANANANRAEVELNRATALIKSQAIAQRIYDDDANAKRVADAAVLSAEAAIKTAQVDLDHAYIKAPISGRISRAEITLGNVVQAGANAPLLTSIVSNDGIYADFDVDDQTYLDNVRSSASTADMEHKIPVQMRVQGDSGAYKGTISSFDNRINASSGTIRARAKFDNRDGKLVPGMFIAVKLGGGMEGDLITVSDRAIGQDQNKSFVFAVGADNKVAYREVTLGREIGGRHIVVKGVEPGDRIIVDGIQHVQPGMPVAPKEDSTPSSSGGIAP